MGKKLANKTKQGKHGLLKAVRKRVKNGLTGKMVMRTYWKRVSGSAKTTKTTRKARKDKGVKRGPRRTAVAIAAGIPAIPADIRRVWR